MSGDVSPGSLGAPRVLQSGGRDPGLGNQLLLYEIAGRPALLKVYRRRRAAWRDPLKRFSYRFLEGRRGVTARQRRELERASLALWASHGFDVPALLDHPVPPELAGLPTLWLEYCPGTLLVRLLADERRPPGERAAAAERFGRELGRRQRLALELGERRLVMGHAGAKHVLVCGDRQVSFDLETGYAPGYPLLAALAEELAACLRSVLRAGQGAGDVLGAACVRGYGDDELLRRLVRQGLEGGGLRGWLRRRSDSRRRPALSEVDALRWLAGARQLAQG